VLTTARRIHHPAIACALACALLVAALGGTAAARSSTHAAIAAPLAQERYYSSYGEPPQSASALAQERYYSSYGEPEPLTVPQSPAPSDDTPWGSIAIALAIMLALAAARTPGLRTRRRAGRVTA
jgi:hypothetical protein